MPSDPSTIARHYVANATAAAEVAFLAAFQDGVEQACEELDDPEVDDEVACDWELLLHDVADERASLMRFYLPAVNKMAGELTTLYATMRARALQYASDGLSDIEIESRLQPFRDAIKQRLEGFKRRLAQLIEGLAWAAAELGFAAVARDRKRRLVWVLDPAADHCSTCPVLAVGSPYDSIADIGGVPGGDLTQCRSRCRCHLEYL